MYSEFLMKADEIARRRRVDRKLAGGGDWTDVNSYFSPLLLNIGPRQVHDGHDWEDRGFRCFYR